MKRLVIERKSLVWPDSYVELHSTDHELADAITTQISSEFDSGCYLLELPGGVRAGRKEREALILSIVKDILQHSDAVKSGAIVGDDAPIRWRFRKQEPDEREPWEEQSGIEMRFWLGDVFERYARRNNSLSEIDAKLDILLRHAERKFRTHSDAASILLLACHTDEISLNFDMMKEMVERRIPAPTVDQIWIALPPLDEFDDPDAWYAVLYERANSKGSEGH